MKAILPFETGDFAPKGRFRPSFFKKTHETRWHASCISSDVVHFRGYVDPVAS